MIGRLAIAAAALSVATGAAVLHPAVAAPAQSRQPSASARAAVKAATPMIHAPAAATLGQTVRITTSGLVRGRYALSLVADRRPARGAVCLARLAFDRRRSAAPGFMARIPSRLRCYQGANRFLGRVPDAPGACHFVVGVPVAPAGSDGRYSLVRAAVRISR